MNYVCENCNNIVNEKDIILRDRMKKPLPGYSSNIDICPICQAEDSFIDEVPEYEYEK